MPTVTPAIYSRAALYALVREQCSGAASPGPDMAAEPLRRLNT
jgi:hypothetical protein